VDVRSLVIALVLALAGCGAGGQVPARPAPGSPGGARVGAPYRPAGAVSARLYLPSRTMAAGSSMPVRVIVVNNTGHAIHVAGCLTLFQVALVSDTYHPAVAWFTCLQTLTIRAGISSYPVTLSASYSECSQGRPRDGMKACLRNRRSPPLPAGVYRATLFQAGHIVPAPPAIPVRVTPAGSAP
jgi:hypothetical protein